MRFLLTYLLAIVYSTDLIAQNSLNEINISEKYGWNENFDTLILKCNLSYDAPLNFETINRKKNQTFNYQYAIKHIEEPFEIRYLFIKMNSNAEGNPNSSAKENFEEIVKNVSQNGLSSMIKTIEYSSQNVRSEFNADWGATISFFPNSEFGGKYKHCVASTIIKDSTCQIIVFFMFQDVQKQKQLLSDHYYNIKFNKPDNRKEVRYPIKKEESFPGEFDFYINTTSNYLRVRTENKTIKDAHLSISDNFGRIHFQGLLVEHDFYLYTLPKGQYKLKIDYNGKQIKRVIEIY